MRTAILFVEWLVVTAMLVVAIHSLRAAKKPLATEAIFSVTAEQVLSGNLPAGVQCEFRGTSSDGALMFILTAEEHPA